MGWKADCLVGAVVAALAGAAPADTVKLSSGIVYDKALRLRLMGAADGALSFRLGSGVSKTVPMADIAAVSIEDAPLFNRAEALAGQGKIAEAAAAYKAAEAGETGWRKELIRYRLLWALDSAGKIDEAVRLWLEVADGAGGSKGVVALRPGKLAPAGAAANDAAIALLKDKKAASKAYVQAIRSLLAELYERQGRKAEAAAVRAELAATAPPAATAPVSEQPPPAGQTDSAEELRLAAVALADGRLDAVIRRIKPILTELDAKALPKALHLLGTAQLKQAAGVPDADAARPILLEAGLNLMRVAVLLPTSPEAPLAFVSAGEVNERLDNKPAAQAAYEEVIRLYPGSAAARTARMGLARVKSGK